MPSPAVTRILAVVAVTIAIRSTADAQQSREYRRGSVVIGGERFQAERLVVTGDSLSFVVKGSGQPKAYHLSQVEYATRIRTHAREGALVGGGLMLLGALLGIAQAEEDPDLEVRDNAAEITLALTAGGILLGGLIGNALTSEKSIIQNGRFMASLGFGVHVPPGAGSPERALAGVVVRF